MDNQQTQALFAAANAAGVSLNQLAAVIAEASTVLQRLASAANMPAATQGPTGGQPASGSFPPSGGAPLGQQPNIFAPGQNTGYAPPSGPGAAPNAGATAPLGQSANPGAGAPDAGKRKRRTKAEIAADEAAIAAGYLSHADMLAKTGGTAALAGTGAAAPGTGQAPANMQQTAMAPGNGPVQGMQPMQTGMPGAPQQQPAGPTPDETQAAFIRVINAVESIWPGHGQGQAGILYNRYSGGVANVGLMTPEKRSEMIQWCDYFIQELQAGRLPNGAEGLPAPKA